MLTQKLSPQFREQAGNILHTSNLYYIQPQAELAKLLIDNSDMDQCFFCNSGAEANEAAIKLASEMDERQRQNRCIRNHHDGQFRFTDEQWQLLLPQPRPNITLALNRCLKALKYVPFDDLDATESAIGPKTCAILVEPIQSEGGVNIPSDDYLQGLRETFAISIICCLFLMKCKQKWVDWEHFSVIKVMVLCRM